MRHREDAGPAEVRLLDIDRVDGGIPAVALDVRTVDRTGGQVGQGRGVRGTETVGHVVDEVVEGTADPVAQHAEVQTDVLHDGLLPGDIRIVGGSLLVGDVGAAAFGEGNQVVVRGIGAVQGGTEVVVAGHTVGSTDLEEVDPADILHELLVEDLPRDGDGREEGVLAGREELVGTVTAQGGSDHVAVPQVHAGAGELRTLLVLPLGGGLRDGAGDGGDVVVLDDVVGVVVGDAEGIAPAQVAAHADHGVNLRRAELMAEVQHTLEGAVGLTVVLQVTAGLEQLVEPHVGGDVGRTVGILGVVAELGLGGEPALDDVGIRDEVGADGLVGGDVRHLEHRHGVRDVAEGKHAAILVVGTLVGRVMHGGGEHTVGLGTAAVGGTADHTVVDLVLVEVDRRADLEPFGQVRHDVGTQREALVVVVDDVAELVVEVAGEVVLDVLGAALDPDVVGIDVAVAEDLAHPVIRGSGSDLRIGEALDPAAVVGIRAVDTHLVVDEVEFLGPDVHLLHILLAGELGEIRIVHDPGVGSVIGDTGLALLAFLGGDEHDTVGCRDTVDGSGSVLQDLDGLDIIRVEAGQAGAVDGAREHGGRAAGGAFEGTGRHDHAVHDVERGAATADGHVHTAARLGGGHRGLQTGGTSHQELGHVGRTGLLDVIDGDLGDSRGQILFRDGAVTGHNRLVEQVDIVREDHVHDVASADGDLGGLVADGGELEDITRLGGDGVVTVDIGDGTAGLAGNHDACADDRLTLAVQDLSGHSLSEC